VSKHSSNKNKGEEEVEVMDTMVSIKVNSLRLKIFSHISFMGLTYLVVIDSIFNNKGEDQINSNSMFM
jgi:hypothetical protein